MRTTCDTSIREQYPSSRALEEIKEIRKRKRKEKWEQAMAPRLKRVHQVMVLESYYPSDQCDFWGRYGGNLSTILPDKTPARTDRPPIIDKKWWNGFSEARLLHDYQYPKSTEKRKRKIVDRWVSENVPDISVKACIIPDDFADGDVRKQQEAIHGKLQGWVSQSLSKWHFPAWLKPDEKELFKCFQRIEDSLADDCDVESNPGSSEVFMRVRSVQSQRQVRKITATQLLKKSGELYQTVYNHSVYQRVWKEQSRYTKEQREWIAANIDYYLNEMGLGRDSLPDPKMIYRIDSVAPTDSVQTSLWERRLRSLLCAARNSMLLPQHKKELQNACRHQVASDGNLDQVIATWNRLDNISPWTVESVWGVNGILGKPLHNNQTIQFQLQMEAPTKAEVKRNLSELLEKASRQKRVSDEDRYRIFLLNRQLLTSQTTYEDVVTFWNEITPKHFWSVDDLLGDNCPLADPEEFISAMENSHHPGKAFERQKMIKAAGNAVDTPMTDEESATVSSVLELQERSRQLSNDLFWLKRKQLESTRQIEEIRKSLHHSGIKV
ncbi:hypothetical protein M3P05_19445 [Sansalvadorimonas sp. 2012CJ34-2]|uniref:Uncharacterized protein n=1 Tax=Parendozoicomonas callyspongiae TaxID=2942213 RepID=A0ABT0PLH7_9GAMM|nr:hypothetical protein [Sansalvadorimonas sp. 2012CJ34-2]MCL6272101.1 hypothetical protein [Sansalvadorimonas sp. 2012CJ34-2]